jgi:hypothetical protein
MKRTILSLLFLAIALPTYAQQITTLTTVASGGGNVNCIGITMSVNRVQDSTGTIQTWLSFAVRECRDGATIPNYYLATYNAKIPDTDFVNTRTGARLSTDSPYGKVDLTWTLTGDSHQKYVANWIIDIVNQPTTRQTQTQDITSAKITGNIGSWIADRPGYFSIDEFKK